MHITLALFFIKPVKKLSVAHRAESGYGKHLSLTSGKHTRAVNSVKQVNLGVKRTDFVNSSAVNALAVIKQPATNNIFLNLVKTFFDFDFHFGINLIEFLVNFFVNGL